VIGPVGASLSVMQAVDTLQESLGHFILQVGLHPEALTRRAAPSELTRLYSLWAEFLRLLAPLMDSAFGKDTAPQLGFDYREGTLRTSCALLPPTAPVPHKASAGFVP
jgi:hypothetical protein